MADEVQRGHGGVMALLVVFGALLYVVSAQTKAKLGGEVTLVPKYTGDPSEINWKINGNKLVDMEVKPVVNIGFYRLHDRATISDTNGSLTIRDLTEGDSGVYKAEVLVNNVYQDTEITLIVLACPAVPTISDQTTNDRVVLLCECSTPGVTYEWRINGKPVGTKPLYNESRPEKEVTLYCFVDNEVCNKNASTTIQHYVPEPEPLPVWAIVLIVILVLVLVLVVIALLYHFRNVPGVDRIYAALTCGKTPRMEWFFEKVHSSLAYCMTPICALCCKRKKHVDVEKEEDEELLNKGKKPAAGEKPEDKPLLDGGKKPAADEEQPLLDTAESEQTELVGDEVTLVPKCYENPSEINWKINGEKLVDMKVNGQKVFHRLQDRATIDGTSGVLTIRNLTIEDSGTYTAEALVNDVYQYTKRRLTVQERKCITVTFRTNDQLKETVQPCLTIHNVIANFYQGSVLHVLQSDGKKSEFNIEETNNIVIIKPDGDRVKLTIHDTTNVTKVVWKKGGVTQFEWLVSDLKLYANNITLEPGSVTVNNAEGKASYKVEVHSTDDNHISNNTLQLRGNNQVNESPPTIGNEELEHMKTVPPTENGHLEESQSITFHPIKMSNKTEITWKKGNQPVRVNIDGGRFKCGPNGDLTINNVTREDKGTYTVHCEDQEQDQEFIFSS